MVSLSKIAGLMLVPICAGLVCCAFPERTGYDRNIGDYKPVSTDAGAAQASNTSEDAPAKNAQGKAKAEPARTAARSDSSQHKNSAQKVRDAATRKEAAKAAPKPESKGSLEKYASGWIGAKYVYGAASKSKTDCSGFVMQVYKGYFNIALDHNAASMYKDSRGSSVSRGSLREGDLVFFGSFWKIDHVGIYLSGDRFIHASSSKGVMISPMNDKYWSHKYQGGRRFR
jgi:lipoprotein Spr